MGAQGVLIDTLRQLPKVMYGQPVLDLFTTRHGLDMRKLLPFDPRVVQTQVEVMSDFLGEIRKTIRKVNPHAQLHVRVGTASALMGCDVAQIARFAPSAANVSAIARPIPRVPPKTTARLPLRCRSMGMLPM
jgi:hypothetical protein